MKMGDDKLNELLKRAAVPARSPGYWEAFPNRVANQLSVIEPEAEPDRAVRLCSGGWAAGWWRLLCWL